MKLRSLEFQTDFRKYISALRPILSRNTGSGRFKQEKREAKIPMVKTVNTISGVNAG